MQKCQKYLLLETSSSWFSCNINLWTGLDQFPGRHRDLLRQIGPIRRQDSLKSYNKRICCSFWCLLCSNTCHNNTKSIRNACQLEWCYRYFKIQFTVLLENQQCNYLNILLYIAIYSFVSIPVSLWNCLH